MLLLHDSLGYSSAAHFQGAGYTVVAGSPLFGLPHERASATSIAQLSFQTPTVGAGSNATCVAGVLTQVLPLVYETVTFLEIGSSAGTQVRATMQKAAGGWKLFFYRGSSSDLLLETPFFEHSGWVFLEVKAVLSTSAGSIVVRLDGTEVARVEGANTREQTGTMWDRLRLFAHTSLTVKFADLYLCDGRTDHGARYATFLGKVSHSKLLLGDPFQIDWSPIPILPGKARLSILAGQSNMTGRTTSTSSGSWTNPNTRIQIWNRLAGVPAFQPLSATVNSACTFLPANVPVAGPEMRFAERLSAHYAASGDPAPPNHYIVKGVQDGSYLYPTTPDYCWNPSVGGGLYSRLLTQVDAAVAALGGWSQIGSVDFFWLQGENDAIFTDPAGAYQTNLRQFLGSILADIAGHGQRTVAHEIRIHQDLLPTTAPNTYGFYYKDQIRRIQDSILVDVKADLDLLGLDLHYRNIVIDSCPIGPDKIHLTEVGYDRLGDLMFESWSSSFGYRDLVADFEDLSDVDNLWLGASDIGKSMFFTPVGSPDATNSPVLGASSRVRFAASVAGGLSWTARAVGISLGQGTSAISLPPPDSPWYLNQKQAPLIALPEILSLEMGVFT